MFVVWISDSSWVRGDHQQLVFVCQQENWPKEVWENWCNSCHLWCICILWRSFMMYVLLKLVNVNLSPFFSPDRKQPRSGYSSSCHSYSWQGKEAYSCGSDYTDRNLVVVKNKVGVAMKTSIFLPFYRIFNTFLGKVYLCYLTILWLEYLLCSFCYQR